MENQVDREVERGTDWHSIRLQRNMLAKDQVYIETGWHRDRLV